MFFDSTAALAYARTIRHQITVHTPPEIYVRTLSGQNLVKMPLKESAALLLVRETTYYLATTATFWVLQLP